MTETEQPTKKQKKQGGGKQAQQEQSSQVAIQSGTENRLEQVQSLRKQMEELHHGIESLFQNSGVVMTEETDAQEGILRPDHSFGDQIGDRIFGPGRNSHLSLAQQYVNDAQNMMKMALEMVQKAETEDKKKKEDTTTPSPSTELATTTNSTSSSQLVVHKVVPVTKMSERGSHVEAVVQVPFANMDDIRFSYVVDNNSSVLTVRGRQHTGEKEVDEFEVKFDLPKNTDVSRARANVQGRNLCVNIPKQRKRSRTQVEEDQGRSRSDNSLVPAVSSGLDTFSHNFDPFWFGGPFQSHNYDPFIDPFVDRSPFPRRRSPFGFW